MTPSQNARIPDPVVPRLSRYYRALLELESRDTRMISSEELSRLTGYSAAQIRKDLTYFGQFGTPGRGYPILELKNALLSILGIDREWAVAVVGAGNLGQALLGYQGFRNQGFKVLFAFDTDRRKAGQEINGIPVRHLSEFRGLARTHGIRMAIVTVPAQAAQDVVDELVQAGVQAILNFAPVRIRVPENVTVHSIDMAIELERLSCMAKNGHTKDAKAHAQTHNTAII